MESKVIKNQKLKLWGEIKSLLEERESKQKTISELSNDCRNIETSVKIKYEQIESTGGQFDDYAYKKGIGKMKSKKIKRIAQVFEQKAIENELNNLVDDGYKIVFYSERPMDSDSSWVIAVLEKI